VQRYIKEKSMTNKGFYAFCRDHRKTEPDKHKKEALKDVYGFMWECGTTKAGVASYIEHQIFVLGYGGIEGGQPRIDAYTWLQGIFDGAVAIAQPAQTLF
jgi:hypothetical protein